MFRNVRDFTFGFNCMAEASIRTDSQLLAEGFLSTHWHSLVRTENPVRWTRWMRYAYTRFFNAQYGRAGRFGSKFAFITEIEGYNHLLTALNYVIRQGLHHGISETTFGYPFCSANAYFRKELGQPGYENFRFMPPELRHHSLTRNVRIPERFRMDGNGLLLREDILDTAYVEQIYVSPRNFLYQMNKLTNERVIADQKEEKSDTPIITIDLIEKGIPDFDVQQFLLNEHGSFDGRHMTDLELCRLIDDFYIPSLKGATGLTETIYTCSPQERTRLSASISRDLERTQNAVTDDKRTLIGQAGLSGKYVTKAQLRRCLVL